ncbi:hypothetical protein N7462_003210 [Penicillium macrosclerotiorum]|uniref:uncharacterized protein n=1 Tax=Penicillium macrosclerotiorum TaxID=303699 RepID=UPI00254967EE|nr:uncharacterized protein N7462_003210 [Penicillium macrosclerotiorum]KAJ5688818.1 hypothetical protein N7462_003210 [Penicillium macrosclerotiorum]
MRLAFRLFIAFALVGAVLLVRNHLGSLESQWPAGQALDLTPEFILESDGAHIELVSIPRGYEAQAVSSSESPLPLSSIAASHSSGPTEKSYPTPTNPPAAKSKFQPKSIPVDVPGAEDDFFDQYPFWFDDDMEVIRPDPKNGRLKSNSKTKPNPPTKPKPHRPKVSPYPDRIIVMGRTLWEDTDWLEEELPEWQHAVYDVDDPDAEFHVQQNKGRESNVYLQYIIDHYDKLPEYMVFMHAHRSSGHVEFWEQDNALTIQRLQLPFLEEAGYVNLRCNWSPGCPDEVHPFRQLEGRTTEIAFAGAWMGIFNNTNIPEVVAAPCCAQFAVTKAQVHARPLSDYQAYHKWLMQTELDDDTSGRVFEYLWHIIFGQEPVFCPSQQQCYQDVYGMDWDPDFDETFGWLDNDF